MKNPKWHRDEIILAMALYVSEERGAIDARNPKIVELSRALNDLSATRLGNWSQTYRNPNGVGMKLANLLYIDSSGKKGMSSHSKLDEKVFREFSERRDLLQRIAKEIMEILGRTEIVQKIRSIEDDEEILRDGVIEGTVLYKVHKIKERDRQIVEDKKKQVLREAGALECEICHFDFHKVYGELGRGFIECHHRIPLASLTASTKTYLKDLALVCANCHRILHRKMSNISVEGLKAMIQNEK